MWEGFVRIVINPLMDCSFVANIKIPYKYVESATDPPSDQMGGEGEKPRMPSMTLRGLPLLASPALGK